MIELKCKRCDTGIFRVEDIARGLGKLPLRLTCHICGFQYIVKPDKNGSPAVYYRQGFVYRKMEIPGLKETEPAPATEALVEEKISEEPSGDEEPAGELEPTGEQLTEIEAEPEPGHEGLTQEEDEDLAMAGHGDTEAEESPGLEPEEISEEG